MKSKFISALALGAVIWVAACSSMMDTRTEDHDYWQRVEDNSALYMKGPKAQQQLDEDISSCVNQIDELVKLDAINNNVPGATNSDYHAAMKKSGDTFDNPTTAGKKKVAHSDFYDYESCMRAKGWERVKYVRYQTAATSKATYKQTQKNRGNEHTFGSSFFGLFD